MKVGDLYKVNSADTHSSSHYGELVVVLACSDGEMKSSHSIVRGYNFNKQRVHDYFHHELTKANK